MTARISFYILFYHYQIMLKRLQGEETLRLCFQEASRMKTRYFKINSEAYIPNTKRESHYKLLYFSCLIPHIHNLSPVIWIYPLWLLVTLGKVLLFNSMENRTKQKNKQCCRVGSYPHTSLGLKCFMLGTRFCCLLPLLFVPLLPPLLLHINYVLS